MSDSRRPQFVSAELLGVGLGAEHGDGRTDRCRLLAMCRQGDILGLASRLGDDESPKTFVDPLMIGLVVRKLTVRAGRSEMCSRAVRKVPMSARRNR